MKNTYRCRSARRANPSLYEHFANIRSARVDGGQRWAEARSDRMSPGTGSLFVRESIDRPVHLTYLTWVA